MKICRAKNKIYKNGDKLNEWIDNHIGLENSKIHYFSSILSGQPISDPHTSSKSQYDRMQLKWRKIYAISGQISPKCQSLFNQMGNMISLESLKMIQYGSHIVWVIVQGKGKKIISQFIKELACTHITSKINK